MKIKAIFILLCAIFVLSACDASSGNDKDERDTTDNTEEVEDVSVEKEKKSSDEDDMEKLASMIQVADEMVDFLNEGVEKVNDYDLSMGVVDYRIADDILSQVYVYYSDYGDAYISEQDNEEYEIFTITKVSKDGRVYNFNNIAYDYEQRDIESIVTDSTYYAEKNLTEHVCTIREPQSTSIDKYLVDDGRLFIVGAQLFKDTLYLDVFYYDGNFVGFARTYYENQSELRIPYDLAEQTPTCFEDLLTEDNYTTYFTYDGTNYEYKGY